MTILILYSDIGKGVQTIHSHLNSFKRYGKGHQIFYLELSHAENLSKELLKIPFDLVIFHYTFLALRFDPNNFCQLYEKLRPGLMALQGIKIMIPQDEYIYTQALWRIINDCDIKRIYSCLKEVDYPTLYPMEIIGKRGDLFRNVSTGYIDDQLLRWIQRHQIPHRARSLDIVFRSTRSTYVFGMMGQQKTKLAEHFIEAVKGHPECKTDICLTLPNSYSNTITGRKWIQFLLQSRTALGTLSGSSLFDPDGSIKEEVNKYLRGNPDATDDDIERECYRGRDGTITSFVLGPRHFECAMTKTCQVLLEGDYDYMIPNLDYIEVKSDFSNMEQVLTLIQDRPYCEKIAEHCYHKLIELESLRYSDFVAFVLKDAAQLLNVIEEREQDKLKYNQRLLVRRVIGPNHTAMLQQKISILIIQFKQKIIMRRIVQKHRAMLIILIVQLKQKIIMQRIVQKHCAMLIKQRLIMLKYALIDCYYRTGRQILTKLEPTHPMLYAFLWKVRCFLKRRRQANDKGEVEKDGK